MTKEQNIFYVGLKKLDYYDDQKAHRDLSYEELKEIDTIKALLFGTVRNYGIDLARKMTQKYRLPSDSYADLCQDMAIIFYEKYRSYNPARSTPTTYFVRYFKQVISKYLIENIHKLSQYDANNVLKVRKAIAQYEEMGIQWTEEMLATKTGLSLKVVKSTIFFAYASNYAQIEDALDLQSHLKTPEETLTEKEGQDTLIRALFQNTDKEELEFFLLRVNLNGSKERPYEEIAKMKHVSVREVKKKINHLICTINQNRDLVAHFSVKTYRSYNELKIQPNTSSILNKQLDDMFSFPDSDSENDKPDKQPDDMFSFPGSTSKIR